MDTHPTTHRRILVALSLLPHDAAFERALALAKTFGAHLYMLHAIPAHEPSSLRAWQRMQRSNAVRIRAEAAGITAEIHEQQGDPAEIIGRHADAAGDGWLVPEYRSHLLGEARRDLTNLIPSSVANHVKVRIAPGPAADTIHAHAADVNADLIVVGRSHRFMNLGAVVTRVLRRTSRALLVVPPLGDARSTGVTRSPGTTTSAPPRGILAAAEFTSHCAIENSGSRVDGIL